MSDIKNKLKIISESTKSFLKEELNVPKAGFKGSNIAGSVNVTGTPVVSSQNATTIGQKRKEASQELSNTLSDENIKREIEQFSMTDEEKRKAIVDFIRKEKLDSMAGEDYYQNVRKLTAELLNRKNELSDKMIEEIKKYNGGKREEEWINSNSITSRHAKSKFGGGGGGGNIDDLYLALILPENIESLPAEEKYNAIKGSIINASKSPQHIFKNFLTPVEQAYVISDEEFENKLNLLNQIVSAEKFPKNQLTNYKKKIQKIRNEFDKSGLDAVIANTETGKTERHLLPKYLEIVTNKAKNLIEKINEAIAPETPHTAKSTVDRYFNWLSNKSNPYYKTFVGAKEAIENLKSLMRQYEVNNSLILGLSNKLRKLDNLKKAKEKVAPAATSAEEEAAAMESIINNIDDFFVVLDDKDFEKIQESFINKIKVIINESPDNEYVRQRKVSEKFKLQEIWKNNRNKILKTEVKPEQKKDNGPDIHLGSLS